MKKRFHTIDVTPVKQEVVSAEEFVRLSKDAPHLIERSRFIPAKIGARNFGRFEVRYTVPLLKQKEFA